LLMVALIFGAHFSSYTYIAPFLLQNASFSVSSITWLLLGFGFVGFISNFAASATVTRNLKASLVTVVLLLMGALLTMPLLRHSEPAVMVLVLVWGVAFGAIPLCLSVWMQLATPDLPEAGSALFVGIIQVAIAVGSLVGGAVVDQIGIPADFWFGSALALLGLAAIAGVGVTGTSSANAELTGQVRPE
jgi:predicted MFS family arabinose efflux permease